MACAGRLWPSALRPGTREGKLSLDADWAPPFGDRRAVNHARTVTALSSRMTRNAASSSPGVRTSQAGAARARDLRAFLHRAIVNVQPPPLSVVTLSDDQMAKIKG